MKKIKPFKSKLTKEERRLSIIEAAVSIFARNGFHGAFVKDIAKAAGISEALLYRHFVSKEEIYECLINYIDIDLFLLINLFKNKEPSGRMLVEIIYCLITMTITSRPEKTEKRYSCERLLIYSHVENPEYLKDFFSRLYRELGPIWDKCMKAAEKNNELKKDFKIKNSMWLIHHLANAINFSTLAGENILPYKGKHAEFVNETILFALQGTGLKDEYIKEYYKPGILQKMLPEAY